MFHAGFETQNVGMYGRRVMSYGPVYRIHRQHGNESTKTGMPKATWPSTRDRYMRHDRELPLSGLIAELFAELPEIKTDWQKLGFRIPSNQ